MSSPLPEFERPPVEEVVIGVQFEPLELHAVHFGSYWLQIRERYPSSQDQPPLAPQIEQDAPQVPSFSVRAGLLPLRCWFLNSTETELIQLQKDRFLRNWRQIKGNERYPRFAYLIEKFREELTGFLKFVDKEGLGRVQVNQCELSHLEPGIGLESYSDFAKVFTTIREPGKGFLPEPELQSWESPYKLPDGRGPILRSRDLKLTLAFTLTARGAPSGNKLEDIFSWFEPQLEPLGRRRRFLPGQCVATAPLTVPAWS